MWMMMQTEKPDDFVVATGETHSIREFVEKAFAVVGMTISYVIITLSYRCNHHHHQFVIGVI
jgi:GDP-D-mannose dehydratase